MSGGARAGAPPTRVGVAWAVLGAGVAIAATSSILVRWAQAAGVASLDIAAVRMTIAALLVTGFVLVRARDGLHAAGRREVGLAALAGAFLAVHFGTWISSLEYTSVASSAALVTTNPIWVGIASVLVLRERLAAPVIAGIGLAIAGSLAIVAADAGGGHGSDPLLGNGLALAGAVAVSGYFLVSRALRARIALSAFLAIAWTSAAACLLVAAAAAPGAGPAHWAGASAAGWLAVAGLALGPQLLGHGAFNWALRRLSATVVAVAILGEPIGSALFAWLLFGETIAPLQGAGFALLLAGIATAALGESRQPSA